ncbi:MAG: alpha/beta hydrolase [Lawsonibacter sp.]|nr:alpha/beta hydrolase [Lawsonibacter sp.]
MLKDVTHHNIQVEEGVFIHAAAMGQGEPLLLLHGHPETWLMWHKMAPQLAKRFTVVASDLRGYGDSSKPESIPGHGNYSKRVMAEDQIKVMKHLGFDRFHVMGHDRGARVGYRMALDHPEAVDKLVLLDIVSTYDMYALSSREFSKALFQWYFFTQAAPLPEDMICASRDQFFRYSLHISRYHSENDTSAEHFPPEVYQEYFRCYTPETIRAICEEYRAGETVDLALDEEDLKNGKKIQAETLVLWGGSGLVERFFRPMECWAKFGDRFRGHPVPCGHFIPEEAPEEALKAVEAFL